MAEESVAEAAGAFLSCAAGKNSGWEGGIHWERSGRWAGNPCLPVIFGESRVVPCQCCGLWPALHLPESPSFALLSTPPSAASTSTPLLVHLIIHTPGQTTKVASTSRVLPFAERFPPNQGPHFSTLAARRSRRRRSLCVAAGTDSHRVRRYLPR